MKNIKQEKKELLENLVNLRVSVSDTLSSLKKIGHGFVDDDDAVLLSKEHVISALERFMAGEVSADDIDRWADGLEMREDVIFGEDGDKKVFNAISDIDTHRVVHGAITKEFARKILKSLV